MERTQKKLQVIYEEGKDPNQEGVTHIAINTNVVPPYVVAVYSLKPEEELPELPHGVLGLSLKTAKREFDFVEGSLEDIVRQ